MGRNQNTKLLHSNHNQAMIYKQQNNKNHSPYSYQSELTRGW